MIHGGFCRNCLADWMAEAAAERGVALSKDEARTEVYGMTYAEWKRRHHREATPEQVAAFEKAQTKRFDPASNPIPNRLHSRQQGLGSLWRRRRPLTSKTHSTASSPGLTKPAADRGLDRSSQRP